MAPLSLGLGYSATKAFTIDDGRFTIEMEAIDNNADHYSSRFGG
jgi:hypothetical protein